MNKIIQQSIPGGKPHAIDNQQNISLKGHDKHSKDKQEAHSVSGDICLLHFAYSLLFCWKLQ